MNLQRCCLVLEARGATATWAVATWAAATWAVVTWAVVTGRLLRLGATAGVWSGVPAAVWTRAVRKPAMSLRSRSRSQEWYQLQSWLHRETEIT